MKTRGERREEKRRKQKKGKRMRGDRSVFTIWRRILKRGEPIEIMTIKEKDNEKKFDKKHI